MDTLLAFGGLSPMELLVVAGVIVLLFGAHKIPTLARSLGSGLTEFRRGLRDPEV
ncbi:MAG TPA: twin-arginine translocase TatA/TatE family subunit [Planctomycetota bacterium]|nr:twin-arginine translocase TatA/TatE family subunit [Planctomycetota bacterium]